jgi:ribosomal protein S18 acetylase RimI-like enzyme
MKITKYKPEHEEAVLSAIKNDPNWEMFTNDDAIETYKSSLEKSVTYVCHDNSGFCGYVRALLDEGFAIYVSELYVIPRCRNRKIGRSLLERVKVDFPNLAVYALSDEDAYYENIGYEKTGSVFKLQ